MKKTLLAIGILLFSGSAFSQLSYNHTYTLSGPGWINNPNPSPENPPAGCRHPIWINNDQTRNCIDLPRPRTRPNVHTFRWTQTREWLNQINPAAHGCIVRWIARDSFRPPPFIYSESTYTFEDPNPDIPHEELTAECRTYDPGTINSGITLNVTVRPSIYIESIPPQICGDVATFVASGSWPEYQWYYQIGSGSWTRLSGQTENTLTFNRSDLGLAYEENFFIGVSTGGTLDQMHSPTGTSNTTPAHEFVPAPPAITLQATSPTCPGGEGSILVEHLSPIPLGARFTYTITKLVPMDAGPCPTDPVIGADGVQYCEGFIATWDHTFGPGDSRVIDLGTITPSVASGDPFDLSAGYFEVLVEDANVISCFAEAFTVMTDPPAMEVSVIDATRPSCFGGNNGSVEFEITNGNPDEVYSWSFDSSSGTWPASDPPPPYQIPNLQAGTYNFTIGDGCSPDVVINETIPPGPELTLNVTSSPVTCFDGTSYNGSITASTNPNISGAIYSLIRNDVLQEQATEDIVTFEGLGDGQYDVTVSVHGCMVTTNTTVASLEPTMISTPYGSPALCFGGTGRIILPGISNTSGQIQLSYMLSGGTTRNGTITSAGDFHIEDLIAGTYTIDVTDDCNNNAVLIDNQIVTVSEPAELAFTVDGTEIVCYDGEDGFTRVSLTGGIPPFEIDVINTRTGERIEDRTVIATTEYDFPVSGLSRGDHEVIVREVGACNHSVTHSFSVSVVNGVSTAIVIDAFTHVQDVTCYGAADGILSLQVSGGNPFDSPGSKAYTVQLVNASGNTFDHIAAGARDEFQFQDLDEGTYYPRVLDENGCEQNFSSTTLTIDQPPDLLIESITPMDFEAGQVVTHAGELYVLCHDGEVRFQPAAGTVTGGVPDYTYYLENVPFDGSVAIDVSGLLSLDQVFQVIDNNGCTNERMFTLQNPETLSVTLTDLADYLHGLSVQCHGDNTGQIQAIASGGVAPYDYVLTGSSTDTRTDASDAVTFSDLTVGTEVRTYRVTVTDALGCITTEEITLTPPTSVVIASIDLPALSNEVHIPCRGDEVAVNFRYTGGAGDYVLYLSKDGGAFNGEGGVTTLSLDAGSYQAYIEDAESCSSEISSFVLTEPENPLELEVLSITFPPCINGDDGEIAVSASGGISWALVSLPLTYVLFAAATVFLATVAVEWAVVPALVLAGIAPASAPAATFDVIRENHATGQLTKTLMRVVAIDDALGILLFSILLAVAEAMAGGGSAKTEILWGLWDVSGAIILGLILGQPMARLTGRLRKGEPAILEAAGFVFLCGGLATLLHVSYLLACMVLGAVVANRAKHHTRPFHAIEGAADPFLTVFFVLAGFRLEFSALESVGLLGMVYIVARSAALVVGGRLGARISGAPEVVREHLGWCLLPQAGVALGLGLLAAERLPEIGERLLPLIIASTVVFEVVGPMVTRHRLRLAGELDGDPK